MARIVAGHVRHRANGPPRQVALLLAALLAAASLTGCASGVHAPFLPGYDSGRAPLVRIATSQFDRLLT